MLFFVHDTKILFPGNLVFFSNISPCLFNGFCWLQRPFFGPSVGGAPLRLWMARIEDLAIVREAHAARWGLRREIRSQAFAFEENKGLPVSNNGKKREKKSFVTKIISLI
jgi:hypothetical protein